MSFRSYWLALPVHERKKFARRCGASPNYLNLYAFGQKARVGEALAIAIERETAGAVTVEELRPDVDWSVIRGHPAAPGPTEPRLEVA